MDKKIIPFHENEKEPNYLSELYESLANDLD